MYQQINFNDFERAFINMDRDNQFTYLGKKELFDWLECLEDGKSVELDVIALCCEFTEYESIEEFQKDYGKEYKNIEDIEYNTIVIPVITNKDKNIQSFIVANF
jgi:hypothetical protein